MAMDAAETMVGRRVAPYSDGSGYECEIAVYRRDDGAVRVALKSGADEIDLDSNVWSDVVKAATDAVLFVCGTPVAKRSS